MIDQFEAPVPGSSLTMEPGGQAYERPPQIVDVEEAIQMHLTRLSEKEKLEGIVDALELGITVKELTTGLLRSAVAEGIHTIDISMLVAPIVHEFIKNTADEAGVEYEEGMVDEEKVSGKRKEIDLEKARFKLKKERGREPEAPAEEPVEVPSEAKPTGMMKRRGTA